MHQRGCSAGRLAWWRAGGAALSLLVFNRMPDQDMWAWYFWGSYSLGMCAFWAARAPRAWAWGLGMAAVGLLALWLEFRARIAVALVAALLLMAVKRHGVAWRGADWLPRLGQMSYSVFLVHFSVCLLVNAVVNHLWPDAPWPNLLGMVLAFGLSIAAGRLLYLRVERHVPSWSVALRWQAGMVGTGMLVALASSRF